MLRNLFCLLLTIVCSVSANAEAYKYCIYDVAKTLYDNSLMPTYAGHEALYNNILKIVDKDYGIVDYDWKNTVAPSM